MIAMNESLSMVTSRWSRQGAPRSRRTAYRIRVGRRVLSALLVGVAVWVVTDAIRPRPPTPSQVLVVAARDLPAGTRLVASDLTTARLGSGSATLAALGDPTAAVGQVLDSPVAVGETISTTRLRGPAVITGLRSGQLAVAVPVANAAILELAREGDRVRLIGTAGGGASVEGIVLSLGARARASTGSPALLDGAGAPLSDSLNSAGAGRAGSAGVMGGQALVVSLSEKDARVVAQEFGAAGAGSGFVVAIYPAS